MYFLYAPARAQETDFTHTSLVVPYSSFNNQVVGLTNRPELLDEALLRPGRLEVHLKVQLPDARGRAQILNIHSRHMRANGALSLDALALLDPPLGDGRQEEGDEKVRFVRIFVEFQT